MNSTNCDCHAHNSNNNSNNNSQPQPKTLSLHHLVTLLLIIVAFILVIGGSIPAYRVYEEKTQLYDTLKIVPVITQALNDNNFHIDSVPKNAIIRQISVDDDGQIAMELDKAENVKERNKGAIIILNPLYDARHKIISWSCMARNTNSSGDVVNLDEDCRQELNNVLSRG
jgi:hypothetical protein